MNFYTVVIRQSAGYWVGLCLENCIVGQGKTPEDAVNKIKESIESFQSVYESEPNIYQSPISIEELHEFLLVEEKQECEELLKIKELLEDLEDLRDLRDAKQEEKESPSVSLDEVKKMLIS